MNDEEHEKHFIKKTAKEKTVETLLQQITPACFIASY